MKHKFLAAFLLLAVLFTGCTVWDDSRDEIRPLPETDGVIDTDPWDGGQDDGGSLGH